MTPIALLLSLLLAKGLALPGLLPGRTEGRFRRAPGISTSSEEEDLLVFLPMHKDLRGLGSEGKFKEEDSPEQDNEHTIVLLTEEQFPLEDLEKLAQVELEKFEPSAKEDSATFGEQLGEKLLGIFPPSDGNRIQFGNLASDVPPAPLSLSLAEGLKSSGENVTEESMEVPLDDTVRFPIETLEDLALILTVLNNTDPNPEELAAVMQLIDTEQKLLGGSSGLGSLLGLGGGGGVSPFIGQLMSSPFGQFLSGTPLGSLLQNLMGGSGGAGAAGAAGSSGGGSGGGGSGGGGSSGGSSGGGESGKPQGGSGGGGSSGGGSSGGGSSGGGSSGGGSSGGGSSGGGSGGGGGGKPQGGSGGGGGGGKPHGGSGGGQSGGGQSGGGGSGGGGMSGGGMGGGGMGGQNCFPQGRICQTYLSVVPCCGGMTCQAFSNSLLNSMTMGNLGHCS